VAFSKKRAPQGGADKSSARGGKRLGSTEKMRLRTKQGLGVLELFRKKGQPGGGNGRGGNAEERRESPGSEYGGAAAGKRKLIRGEGCWKGPSLVKKKKGGVSDRETNVKKPQINLWGKKE